MKRFGLILLLLLVGCTARTFPLASDLRGAVFDPPTKLEDFTFASTTGEPFTLSDYRGKIVLLFFGYLTCPDFCPLTLSEMKFTLEALNELADQVQVVFVTVDPERDSLEKMRAYLARFNPNFIGIREEGDTLQELMNQFGAIAKKQSSANSTAVYLVDHTASVFLISADGQLAMQYLYGTDYRDIVHDLEMLLS